MQHSLEHLAIIMDGNRRWAKERGKNAIAGHLAGYEVFKKATNWCFDAGIKIITVWAFSTENWRRDKKEVDFLMKLLSRAIKEELETVIKKNVRFNVIGRRNKLPANMVRLIEDAEEKTKNNQDGILNIAIDYGGRTEILDAVKQIIKKGITSDKINESVIENYLYTAGIQPPDLIVRTSGEQRLSGFMPWQTVYSELMFLDKYWPEFTENDVFNIIEEFSKRNRRYGK